MIGFEDTPIDWAPAAVWTTADGVRHQQLTFIVPGTPKPKGNVIKGRYGGYHDATKGLDDWLATISGQAKAAMKGNYRRRNPDSMTFVNVSPPCDCSPYLNHGLKAVPCNCGQAIYSVDLPRFDTAVFVNVTFVLHRPQSTIIDGKRWDLTKSSTPPHTKKPDADKLFRAVGDAMTGIVFPDDAQIVQFWARKRYALLGETSGAIITITDNVDVP
jgi:hypothetical protein